MRRLRRTDFSRTVTSALEAADGPLELEERQRHRIDRRCGRVTVWTRDLFRFFRAGPRPRPDREGT